MAVLTFDDLPMEGGGAPAPASRVLSFDDLPDEPARGPGPQAAVDAAPGVRLSAPAPAPLPAVGTGGATADVALWRPQQEFALGATDTISSALRGAAAMQSEMERNVTSTGLAQRMITGPAADRAYAQRLQKTIAESGLEAKRTPTTDKGAYKAAGAVDQWAADTFGVPVGDPTFLDKFSRGAGSFATFFAGTLLGAPITGGATALGGTLGALANSGSIYQEAIAAGATEDQALDAAGVARVVGSSEVVPILDILKPLDRVFPELKGRLVAIAGKALRDATEEGLQEGLSQIANNLIASGYYDPKRGWSEGVTENAIIGFGLGGLAGGAIGTIEERSKRKAGEKVAAQTEAPLPPRMLSQEPLPELPVTQDQIDSPIQTPLLQKGQAILDAAVAGDLSAGAVPAAAPEAEKIVQNEQIGEFAQTPPAAAVATVAATPVHLPETTAEIPQASLAAPEEAAILSAAGWSAEDIADMSPAERSAEAEQARAQGVIPAPVDTTAPAPLPQPSAEPDALAGVRPAAEAPAITPAAPAVASPISFDDLPTETATAPTPSLVPAAAPVAADEAGAAVPPRAAAPADATDGSKRPDWEIVDLYTRAHVAVVGYGGKKIDTAEKQAAFDRELDAIRERVRDLWSAVDPDKVPETSLRRTEEIVAEVLGLQEAPNVSIENDLNLLNRESALRHLGLTDETAERPAPYPPLKGYVWAADEVGDAPIGQMVRYHRGAMVERTGAEVRIFDEDGRSIATAMGMDVEDGTRGPSEAEIDAIIDQYRDGDRPQRKALPKPADASAAPQPAAEAPSAAVSGPPAGEAAQRPAQRVSEPAAALPPTAQDAIKSGWQFELTGQTSRAQNKTWRFKVTRPDGTTVNVAADFPKDRLPKLSERREKAWANLLARDEAVGYARADEASDADAGRDRSAADRREGGDRETAGGVRPDEAIRDRQPSPEREGGDASDRGGVRPARSAEGDVADQPDGDGEGAPRKFARADLGETIDAALANRSPDAAVEVGASTPDVLRSLGAADRPVTIATRVLRKAMEDKHGMSAAEVKAAISQIDDPVMVFDSATSPDSLVVLVEATSGGAPVVAAIHMERQQRHGTVHSIASIHPRRPAGQIVGWMRSGLLRYVNDRKAGSWSQSRGLRLPKEGIKNRLGHKILRHRDVFKPAPKGRRTGLPADGLTFEATPGFLAARADVIADLRRRLARLAPGVDLAVVERLFHDGDRLHGTILENLITVALDGKQVSTLGHEAIHWLRSAGLIRSAEWAALRRAALADEALMARVRKREPDLSEDAQVEEAVADLFGDWYAGQDARGFIGKAVDRVREFLRALGQALRGKGFATKESVFRRIEGGETGAQAATREPAQDRKFSRDDTKPGEVEVGPETERKFSRAEGVERIEKANVASGFNPQNPAPGPSLDYFEAPTSSARNVFWRWMKDDKERLLRAQRAIEKVRGAPLEESVDAYLATNLYETQRNNRLNRFHEETVKPILDEMDRRKVTSEDLRVYLVARHAPERNAEMARRDPGKWSTQPGSGVSDMAAAQLLADLKAEGKTRDLEAVARMVDAMIKKDLADRHLHGLLTQEEFDAWKNMYKHYVPLRGWAEREDGENNQVGHMGSGFDIRGPEARKALGRMTQSEHPLFMAIQMAQEGIIRVEKNRVGKTILKLAQNFRNDEMFRVVGRLPTREVPDLTNGGTTRIVDYGALDRERILAVKVGGKVKYLELSPELAFAMKNLGLRQTQGITGAIDVALSGMRTLTRTFSRLQTGANPDFFVPNAQSDFFESLMTAAGEKDVERLARRFAWNYPQALTQLTARMTGLPGRQEWDKWVREWEDAGGKMEFMGFKELGEIQSDVERRVGERGRGLLARRGKQVLHLPVSTVRAIERLNAPFENAARLAMYVSARQSGVTKAKAAMLSLEASGNYMRRGQATNLMGALYPFFNASMAGIEKFGRFAADPRVYTFLASVPLMGFLYALTMAGSTPDDDDPEGTPLFFKVNPWERGRGIIIPTGDHEDENGVKRLDYVTIRIPHNLRPLWILGDQLAEMMYTGRIDRMLNSVVAAAAQNFNPVGGDDWFSAVMPLPLDPALELSRNRNWFGAPIRPEPYAGDAEGVPSQTYFPGRTSPAAVWAAQAMNEATGGSSVTPGWISVYPNHIDYLAEFMGGGLLRFLSRGWEMGSNVATGVPLDRERIPLFRTFRGGTNDRAETGRFYEMKGEAENQRKILQDAKKLIERGDSGAGPVEEMQGLAHELGAAVTLGQNIDWGESWTTPLIAAAKGKIAQINADIKIAQNQRDKTRAEIAAEVRALEQKREIVMRQARADATRIRLSIKVP